MMFFLLDILSVTVMWKMARQDYDTCEVDATYCVASILLSLGYCILDFRPVALVLVLIMLALVLIGKEIPNFGLADLCIPANIIGAFGCRIGVCADLMVAMVLYLLGLIIYKVILIYSTKWSSEPFALVPILPSYIIMLPLTYIITNLMNVGGI